MRIPSRIHPLRGEAPPDERDAALRNGRKRISFRQGRAFKQRGKGDGPLHPRQPAGTDQDRRQAVSPFSGEGSKEDKIAEDNLDGSA